MTDPGASLAALEQVTDALPTGGEQRVGQAQMCEAVAEALDTDTHLVVHAGTGTGKSLAYLVPIALAGRTAVVATATKALQDQLAGKDLPHLAASLDHPVDFAVLKGRSNYICRQRLAELEADTQLELEEVRESVAKEIEILQAWAETTTIGDRAELIEEPSAKAWEAVSVGPRECPGASRCPQGGTCFAEAARARAASADIIVVNTHLYGLHVASGGTILPEHEVVVIDEVHQLEEVISNTAGLSIGAGQFNALANLVQSVVADPQLVADLHSTGDSVAAVLDGLVDERLVPAETGELANVMLLGRDRAGAALTALRAVPKDAPEESRAKATRAMQAATALVDELDQALELPDSHVAWVSGGHAPQLRVAPIDVGGLLGASLWPECTAVLTSATVPKNVADRLGLPVGGYRELDVGSPFDFEANGLLYCAADLPSPKSEDYPQAVAEEVERLMLAAGGRTLALFTSWRAMRAVAEHLQPRMPWPVLTQSDMPKPALIEKFSAEPETSLLATMSFWQGVDIPGASLSLVIIDRIPFPRPDEPLLQARRERAGPRAFGEVDLPRAATLLAQGAGRLIRRRDDKGVVAVLDSRLATSKSYRWELINALPPFRRTRHRDEVETFLRTLRDTD
ncbi:MAG: ATP-dependent DNA helicase [Acidimicrobiia bacterium]|nr:ATP-dependent DNA helicase [Acidimicrobiia bacterium]